jgi:hypothetical protein
MRVTAENRGPEAAALHLLPHVWFRNTWSWKSGTTKPALRMVNPFTIEASHADLGTYYLYADGDRVATLFCENESNPTRVWNDSSRSGYWKDAFHERVVAGRQEAVNPAQQGTKAAVWYSLEVPACGRQQVQLRLSGRALARPFGDFAAIFRDRLREADEFYESLQQGIESADARAVQRQAFAGMIWSKQFYYLDVAEWLYGDPAQPSPPPTRRAGRNCEWMHLSTSTAIAAAAWAHPTRPAGRASWPSSSCRVMPQPQLRQLSCVRLRIPNRRCRSRASRGRRSDGRHRVLCPASPRP